MGLVEITDAIGETVYINVECITFIRPHKRGTEICFNNGFTIILRNKIDEVIDILNDNIDIDEALDIISDRMKHVAKEIKDKEGNQND